MVSRLGRGNRRGGPPSARAVIGLLIVVVLLVAGTLAYRRARETWENLGPILVRQLEVQLGREVAIGRIRFPRRGLVVLEEVAVAERERLAQGRLAEAERVEIRYDLWRWIRARFDVVGSVSEVRVIAPWLLVERDAEGRLNLQQLFPPRPGARPTTFRGRVIVQNGVARLRDYRAFVPPLPAVNEASRLDGWVEYTGYPRLTFAGSGAVTGPRAGGIAADGYVDSQRGAWMVTLRASEAVAPYWSRYFFQELPVDVREGRVDGTLTAWREGSGASFPIRLAGVAQGRGLAARVRGLAQPVREGAGRVQWDGSGASFDLTGRLAGMPLTATGRVTGYRQPILAVAATAPSVTLTQLRAVLPLELPTGVALLGPASVTAQITGPLNDPAAQGSIRLTSLQAAGRTAGGIAAGWRYRAGVLYLADARAEGMRLEGVSGWVDLRSRPARVYAAGRVEGLALAEWAPPGPLRLGGVVRGRFAIAGATDRLNGQIGFEATPLVVDGTRLARAVGQVRLRRGLIEVRRFSVVDPAGALLVNGTIGAGGDLNLATRASGLALETLLGPRVTPRVEGTAYFWGEVRGTTARPQVSGNLQVYGARWDNTRVDFVEGRITATRQSVTTERLIARLYPGSVLIRGAIHGLDQPTPTLDLTAELEDLAVDQVLLVLQRPETAAGTVEARLTIAGTPAQPLVSGSVAVTDLVARGHDLGTISAQIRLTPDALRIEELRGGTDDFALAGELRLARRFPEGQRTGLGLSAESPLEGSLALRDLDLELLNPEVARYARLGGDVEEVSLTLSGTLGQPRAGGRLRAEQVSVNGVTIDALAATFGWSNGRATVEEGVLAAEGGRFRILSAAWRPPTRMTPPGPEPSLEVSARVEAFPVRPLLGLIRGSPLLATPEGRQVALLAVRVPETTDGTLTADLSLIAAGPERPLRIAVAGSITDLTLPDIRVETAAPGTATAEGESVPTEPLVVDVVTRVAYEAGRIELTSLQLTRGDSSLNAEGTIVTAGGRTAAGVRDEGGQISLQVDAVSVPMRPLGRFLPILHPAEGVGDLHVDVQGPLRSPHVQASADVDNPTFAGLPFTRLSFPLLDVRAGRIQIQGARLTRVLPDGEHEVTLNGTLPFQWQPLGIPQDGQRNLMVRVPRQSVRHFTDLAGAEASASPIARAATALGQLRDLRGEMEASVTLAGTALRPENAGDFRLFGVAFGIPRAESAVRDLNVHLAFEGDRVTVREFRGESTTGGSFQVSGLVNLGRPEEAAEALDLRMVLQDVRFRSRNLSGLLNERLVGTFRTVDASDPSRAGAIRITGAFQAPQVSGAIHARDTTLTLPAAIPQPTVPPTPPPINPQFNLAMILGANTWLANPSVRLQLVGRLPIAGSLAAPQVRGVLLVQRGTLTLPTARFGVTGEIQVAYAPALAGEDAAPIRVDLEAVGRVRGRDPTTGRSQVYTVTLLARGPLSAAPIEPVGSPIGPPVLFQGTQLGQLSIQASADPPLTQRQIIELIARVEVLQGILAGGGNVDDVLRLEVEQALTTSVVPALFLPFETAVEEALGLSEFAIDVAFREPIQLRLGRQLAGNFWATYARSLTGPVDRYQLELYYRVSPRLRFGYRIEEPFARRTWFLNGTFRF